MTYLVYQPSIQKSNQITKELKEDHAFAEAQYLLESKKTSQVILRNKGSNLLWMMTHNAGKFLMAGTVVKPSKTPRKIPVQIQD